MSTKMVVPIPDHMRNRRPELHDRIHWYVIVGGPRNGHHAWTEACPIGADIVVENGVGKQTRWMYASLKNANAALGRWTGEGEPISPDMPDYDYVGVAG